jgi:hypothetical protein
MRTYPVAFLVLSLSLGCKRAPPQDAIVAAAPPASAAATGADQIDPGELPEGHERALGLALPRAMMVERRFDDSVMASGPVPPEPLANYIRKRVDSAGVEIGVARTVFARAHVRGAPDNHVVRIELLHDAARSTLIVRDITPPPHVEGLDEDERWWRAGMTKDGKIADPRLMQ